jgi:hypothetical protein
MIDLRTAGATPPCFVVFYFVVRTRTGKFSSAALEKMARDALAAGHLEYGQIKPVMA